MPALSAPSSFVPTSSGADAAKSRAAREPNPREPQFEALLRERAEPAEGATRTERAARSEESARARRPERTEQPEKPDQREQPARAERPVQPERVAKTQADASARPPAQSEAPEGAPNEAEIDPPPISLEAEITGPEIGGADLLGPITEVSDPRDAAIDPSALQGVDPNAAIVGKEAAAALFTQAPNAQNQSAPALVSAQIINLAGAPDALRDTEKSPTGLREIAGEAPDAFSLDGPANGAEPNKGAPNAPANTPPLPPGAFAQLVQAAQQLGGRNPQNDAGPAPLDAAAGAASTDPSAAITPPPQGPAQAPPAIAPSAQAARPLPHVPTIAREIVHLAKDGARSFALRLDPVELGRIDVRLDIAKDNSVTATLTADNPQTLADLARNARDLERALNSAGLQLAQNGLNFDLSRRDGQGDRDRPARADEATGPSRIAEGAAPAAPRAATAQRWSNARINLIA